MKMNKDDMIRKIEEEAAGIEVPKSLSPEAVRQMLEAEGSRIRETYKDDPDVPDMNENTEGTGEEKVLTMEEARRKAADKERRKRNAVTVISLAAAALLLVTGVRFFGGRGMGNTASSASSEDIAYEETAAQEILEDTAGEAYASSGTGSFEGYSDLSDFMKPASGYEEIYEAVRKGQKERQDLVTNGIAGEAKEYEKAGEVVEEAAAADMTADHSDTNVREEGVGESDTVKTDGRYIYSLTADQSALAITAASGGDLSFAGEIRPDLGTGSIREFYLSGDRLILIGSYYKSVMTQTEEENTFALTSLDQTHVITYDISDRENPRQKGLLTLDGYYNTTRFYDGFAYILTTADSPFHKVLSDTYDEKEFAAQAIPKVNGEPVAAKDIYCPGTVGMEPALTLTSMDLDQPDRAEDTKVFMGWTSDYYASKDSIYLEIPDWSDGGQLTNLVRIAYRKGSITPLAVGTVPGYLESSFSIDQSPDGYLRTAVTSWSERGQTNGVYIFDQNMQLTGSLTDLAPGEEIKSARFLDDILYLVTFRNTDPLFSIDVSDPSDPKLLGELKIPGFSDYLHFWGEDKLLGLGWDEDERTGETLGLKLSMFDISDPLSVSEAAVYKMKNYWQCDGLYDYRLLLADPEKNLIGFEAGCEIEEGEDEWDWKETYHVFSFENGKFTEKASLDLEEMGRYLGARGIYIGDTFYLVSGKKITAFDMKDGFKKIGQI